MKYICDAPGNCSWFRIESEAEAEQESVLMDHEVAKHFRRERDIAIKTYKSTTTVLFEQNIGLESHIQREMPLFLTLRNADGDGLVTAMLPPISQDMERSGKIIVGKANSDPYPEYEPAIEALGAHFGMTLDRENCYPYNR